MEDISEGSEENTHADDNGVTGMMDTKNKMRRDNRGGGLLPFLAWWKESGSTMATQRPDTGGRTLFVLSILNIPSWLRTGYEVENEP